MISVAPGRIIAAPSLQSPPSDEASASPGSAQSRSIEITVDVVRYPSLSPSAKHRIAPLQSSSALAASPTTSTAPAWLVASASSQSPAGSAIVASPVSAQSMSAEGTPIAVRYPSPSASEKHSTTPSQFSSTLPTSPGRSAAPGPIIGFRSLQSPLGTDARASPGSSHASSVGMISVSVRAPSMSAST
jgi:hypothetical protein